MSESTSSMSDSTSHDNGEWPKAAPSVSLCLWRLSDIFILVMSLTGAVAGSQAASHSECVTHTNGSC